MVYRQHIEDIIKEYNPLRVYLFLACLLLNFVDGMFTRNKYHTISSNHIYIIKHKPPIYI